MMKILADVLRITTRNRPPPTQHTHTSDVNWNGRFQPAHAADLDRVHIKRDLNW